MSSLLRPVPMFSSARPFPALWRCVVLLWVFGVLGALGLAQTEHLVGDYAGSYSGGDSGYWEFTVHEDLSMSGGVYSKWGDYSYGVGTVRPGGGFTVGSVDDGSSFKGTITANGKITGTWRNSDYDISGTFSGTRLDPFITTPSPLPAAVVGAAYKRSLSANGGRAPYVWTLVGGSLPDGLVLSSAGIVSGVPVSAGTSSFTVRVTNQNDYAATKTFSLARTLPVPVVAWKTPKPITYGAPLSAIQLNAASAVPGTFVYTPALGTLLPAGPHTLHVAFAPADPAKHAPAEKTVTLVVNKARQTITLGALPSTLYVGDPDTVLSAVSSSGLPVFISGSDLGVAVVQISTLHVVGAGKIVLTFTRPGDANWLAAPPLKRTITVARRPQSIDFPALAPRALDELDFSPGATATSGLPVVYASSAPKVAAIVDGRALNV